MSSTARSTAALSATSASTKKASGQPEKIASYSNIGALVDVLSVGGDLSANYPGGTSFTPGVLSSVPGNNFESFQGTSMAAPHVTGIWGAIRSSKGCKNKSVGEIEKALEKKGKKIADVNFTRPRTNVPATLNYLGCG